MQRLSYLPRYIISSPTLRTSTWTGARRSCRGVRRTSSWWCRTTTWRRRPTTRWEHKYLGISTQYLHNIYTIYRISPTSTPSTLTGRRAGGRPSLVWTRPPSRRATQPRVPCRGRGRSWGRGRGSSTTSPPPSRARASAVPSPGAGGSQTSSSSSIQVLC